MKYLTIVSYVLLIAFAGCSKSHTPAGDGDADADTDADTDADVDADGDGDSDPPPCGGACGAMACCTYNDGMQFQQICTDTTYDPANCGSCGRQCNPEQYCEASECVCFAGSPCGDHCLDLQNDVNNCGGCGNVCPAGARACRGGLCLTCEEAGLLDCDGDCVRGEVDDHNCGGCGNECLPNTECVSSGCVAGECEDVDCDAGSACCDHVYGGVRGCADLRTDPFNCGGCGLRCLQGDACVDGGCGCAPWTTNCDGDCVDLTWDPSNCGGCGNRCPREQPVCFDSQCQDCTIFQATECGGTCVQLDWDPLHCGDCDTVCEADEYCNAGECEPWQ